MWMMIISSGWMMVIVVLDKLICGGLFTFIVTPTTEAEDDH